MPHGSVSDAPRLMSDASVDTPHGSCLMPHGSCLMPQARAIKAQLGALIPGLRVFLDVDDLTDIGALEALIDATDAVVVFLGGSTADGVERSDYMRSRNCLRELRRAVERKKSIVFVNETDPQHGAVSMATHRRDCPEELRHALDEHPIVPWYRVKEYGQVRDDAPQPMRNHEHMGLTAPCDAVQVSLRQIAQVVLEGELRLPGELLHAPLHIAPLPAGAFHLYAPSSAAEVVALLRAEVSGRASERLSERASPLQITSDPDERFAAQKFLLYLNLSTWNDTGLQAEVEAALDHEMPLLLVHEQRAGHGAVPFGTIIERTPRALLERGIFKSLAVPLYDGDEHQRVCIRVMIGVPVSPPSRRRWRWPVRRRVQIEADDDLPALLESSPGPVVAESAKV